jgi:hypothetical protein
MRITEPSPRLRYKDREIIAARPNEFWVKLDIQFGKRSIKHKDASEAPPLAGILHSLSRNRSVGK